MLTFDLRSREDLFPKEPYSDLYSANLKYKTNNQFNPTNMSRVYNPDELQSSTLITTNSKNDYNLTLPQSKSKEQTKQKISCPFVLPFNENSNRTSKSSTVNITSSLCCDVRLEDYSNIKSNWDSLHFLDNSYLKLKDFTSFTELCLSLKNHIENGNSVDLEKILGFNLSNLSESKSTSPDSNTSEDKSISPDSNTSEDKSISPENPLDYNQFQLKLINCIVKHQSVDKLKQIVRFHALSLSDHLTDIIDKLNEKNKEINICESSEKSKDFSLIFLSDFFLQYAHLDILNLIFDLDINPTVHVFSLLSSLYQLYSIKNYNKVIISHYIDSLFVYLYEVPLVLLLKCINTVIDEDKNLKISNLSLNAIRGYIKKYAFLFDVKTLLRIEKACNINYLFDIIKNVKISSTNLILDVDINKDIHRYVFEQIKNRDYSNFDNLTINENDILLKEFVNDLSQLNSIKTKNQNVKSKKDIGDQPLSEVIKHVGRSSEVNNLNRKRALTPTLHSLNKKLYVAKKAATPKNNLEVVTSLNNISNSLKNKNKISSRNPDYIQDNQNDYIQDNHPDYIQDNQNDYNSVKIQDKNIISISKEDSPSLLAFHNTFSTKVLSPTILNLTSSLQNINTNHSQNYYLKHCLIRYTLRIYSAYFNTIKNIYPYLLSNKTLNVTSTKKISKDDKIFIVNSTDYQENILTDIEDKFSFPQKEDLDYKTCSLLSQILDVIDIATTYELPCQPCSILYIVRSIINKYKPVNKTNKSYQLLVKKYLSL
jgi:hypothetical protein